MTTAAERREAKDGALELLDRAGVVLTPDEKEEMEILDYGLGRLEEIGSQIVEYVNNDKYCAKEIVQLPGQTHPEHRHPPIGDYPGKQETFRCRLGTVYLYVEGENEDNREREEIHAQPPDDKSEYFTVSNEVVLEPGEQHTIPPKTRHWFEPGGNGAVISEFSTKSIDEEDVFTDPEIERVPDDGEQDGQE